MTRKHFRGQEVSHEDGRRLAVAFLTIAEDDARPDEERAEARRHAHRLSRALRSQPGTVELTLEECALLLREFLANADAPSDE